MKMRLVFALVLGLQLACSTTPDPNTIPPELAISGAYTLVGLHPHPKSGRISSANYLWPGFIPRCSSVEFTKIKSDYVVFRVSGDNAEYHYTHHGATGEPFSDHLARVFGSSCDQLILKTMSEVDRKGISAGVAIEGMTKRAVYLALGPPPLKGTPAGYESNRWQY
jgi:hypothetical protein